MFFFCCCKDEVPKHQVYLLQYHLLLAALEKEHSSDKDHLLAQYMTAIEIAEANDVESELTFHDFPCLVTEYEWTTSVRPGL